MILKILFVSIIISEMYMSAFAIKCYQCNSHENEECHNLGLYKPHLTSDFYKECIDSETFNATAAFCRKAVLTIKFPNNEKRTIRSCGWMKSRFDCYKADNDDHTESQCQCFEDGCNGSSGIEIFRTLSFLILVFNVYCFLQ